MSLSARKVCIIGGGIIGSASAHYLLENGYEVTMLEQGRVGSGCSYGNCGLIMPSHLLPLTQPSLLIEGLKSMLNTNAPIYIKPQLSFSFWQWLLKFALHCNTKQMIKAGHTRLALINSSRNLYENLVSSGVLNCEWESQGSLYTFTSKKMFDHFTKTTVLLQDIFKLPIEKMSRSELAEFEPALKSDLYGAYFFPEDAQLHPGLLLSSWKNHLERKGLRIMENCQVQSIVTHNDHAEILNTSQGEISADIYIVSCGAYTPLLQRYLSCKVPIVPAKGYSITMEKPDHCPRIPIILTEKNVVVTPMHNQCRIGSILEFVGYDMTLRGKRIDYLKNSVQQYLKYSMDDPTIEAWCGLRPMTYDGVPYIDWSPQLKNILIAAGHNMLGITMGPATGKLVAELVSGSHPHIDPKPYQFNR